ncbi:MAG TPA: cyanophycinase [Saprospiraceae bacterium]|nr:cyanophycinase [Saprospiraceae bacterium]HNT19280.1 cyanophycinase [Saprospiraceae bacterium]
MRLYPGVLNALILAALTVTGSSQSGPKGSLFIIGGGDRPMAMMEKMLKTADLGPGKNILVLTMASANPDTSYHYIKKDLQVLCANPVLKMQLTRVSARQPAVLDSIRCAGLLYITGGVQSRFMDSIAGTGVAEAIHAAYRSGAMIAGTSAGAAVMSRVMITGNQIRGDTLYEGAVDRMAEGNIETSTGLGLLEQVIIDQHFIVRSRYNRLFTLLHQYPAKVVIGIDESTAILVHGRRAEVTGEGQVVVARRPVKIRTGPGRKIGFRSARLDVCLEGDRFKIKP